MELQLERHGRPWVRIWGCHPRSQKAWGGFGENIQQFLSRWDSASVPLLLSATHSPSIEENSSCWPDTLRQEGAACCHSHHSQQTASPSHLLSDLESEPGTQCILLFSSACVSLSHLINFPCGSLCVCVYILK